MATLRLPLPPPLLLLLLLVLAAPLAVVHAAKAAPKSGPKKLPPFVRKCSILDRQLEKCVMEHGQDVIPRLIKGDPYYHIPNLDPLSVTEVYIQTGGSASTFTMHCSNITLRGIANITMLDIKIDQQKFESSFHAYIPRLQIESDYVVDGRVLLLPIKGSGKGNITFENAYMFYEQKFGLEKRGDHYYYTLAPSKMSFNCSRAHFKLDNLFNGDPVLGNTVNAFLNENWRAVVDDLGQPFVDAAAQVIRQFAEAVIDNVPIEEIFLDVSQQVIASLGRR